MWITFTNWKERQCFKYLKEIKFIPVLRVLKKLTQNLVVNRELRQML